MSYVTICCGRATAKLTTSKFVVIAMIVAMTACTYLPANALAVLPWLNGSKAQVIVDNKSSHSFTLDRQQSGVVGAGKKCAYHDPPGLIPVNAHHERMCASGHGLDLKMALVYRAETPPSHIKFIIKAGNRFHASTIDFADATADLSLKLKAAVLFHRTPAIVVRDAPQGGTVRQGKARSLVTGNAAWIWGGIPACCLADATFLALAFL